MNDYLGVERLRQRHNNFGLLRFGAGWLLVVSVLVAFVPSATVLGIVGMVVAVMAILGATAQRRAIQAMIGQLFELYLHTPEGQQALREEAARQLRKLGG